MIPEIPLPGYVSIDLAWVAVLGIAGGWYVRAFARAAALPRQHHPSWRLVAYLVGLAIVAVCTMSPLEHFGNEALWVNFLGFLLLTMVAPPLILLGSPVTLAFRVANPVRRRSLRRAIRSRLATAVTFPVATWLAFAVVTYIWQFTTLTDLAARNAAARDLQLATLLLVGLLFWLPAVAADPVRWRLAYPVRALYVFVEMTHKALFGGMFLSMNHAFHRDFAARAPDWAPSPMMDQRAAILILWIGGNLIFLLALILIVAGWIAYDARAARRADWRLALERAARERRRQALDQVFRRPV